jgi:hypothetical protein
MEGKPFVMIALLVAMTTGAVMARGTPTPYDVLCDSMITHAKNAATAFNNRNPADADAEVAKVNVAFDAAVTMEPKNPQAYLNMAVFLSNTHKYDESVQMYEKTSSLLGSKAPPQLKNTIDRGIRTAKFKKYSMLRDQTYDGGKGNLREAHLHTLAQLSVTFEPHKVNHDLGTLEVMLCETNVSICASAKRRFMSAAFASQGHYFHGRVPETKARMPCMHSKLRVGNWSDGVVEVAEVIPGVFRNTINEPSRVRGRDGVVTLDHEAHCSLYVPSNDFYTNLADNVLRPESPSQTEVDGGVLSLVQFSGAAFYHWMCEALPRLAVVAQSPFGPAALGMKLLLPAVRNKELPSFITASLDFLFPDFPQSLRVVHGLDTIIRGQLHVLTFDPQPCPLPLNATLHCAALANPGALLAARGLIQRRCKTTGPTSEKPYVVLAGRGGDVTMRMFDEPLLLEKLEPAMGALGLRVVHFDASKFSFQQAMNLFARATGVVGAHGGAMSNILACRQGTPVVEIGFSTIGAQQYNHVAAALGLPFRRIVVAADSQGRALGAPTISFDMDSVVATAVEAFGAAQKYPSDEL